jgi:hypothetical protein
MTKCINGCFAEGAKSHGMCGNCIKRGGKPPQKRQKGKLVNNKEQRMCSRCKNIFKINEVSRWSHPYRCNDCQSWVKRDTYLKRNYGINTKKYEEMLEQSNGGCYICGKTKEQNKERYLSVDHDHSCCKERQSCGKCVRGILCDTCNRAVGLLQDNPENAMAVAMYIKNNKPVDKTLLINLDWNV